MLAAALAILLASPPFLASIPPEPGSAVLTETPTYQAVAADLDGDGVRELVLLVRGGGTSILADAWREARNGAWERIGRPIEVVPRGGTGEQGSVTWTGTPVRLLVRSVDGVDRVTLLRQPVFEEPDLDSPCCLILHDLVLVDGVLALDPVADPADTVDAVWVLDLDGDGTDELVASRSVPPLGDTSYPTETFTHRWNGRSFEITQTQLRAGSGDTPFILGDTDGRPGEELGIIATLGRPELHRVSLHDGDILGVEDAGLVARGAIGVPLGDERGIAILSSAGMLGVHPWPFGEDLAPPLAQLELGEGELLGAVSINDEPRLVVRQGGTADRLHVLGLPGLTPPRFGAVTRTPAAAAFAAGPVTPYVGSIPGGDPDGAPAIVYAGRLLSAIDTVEEVVPVPAQAMATLAGARPIGLVGRDRATIALLHAPTRAHLPDPSGGRLDPPILNAVSAISVAPLASALEPEADGATLDPPITGAVPVGERRTIAVGSAGFAATVEAPPGSRVYVAGSDPSVVAGALAVPDSGTLLVPMPPPPVSTPDPRYRATLAVTTPAGHGYLATWDVRVLTEPPSLRATVDTPFGSGKVEVAGRTAPYARVEVAGRVVPVAADGRFAALVPAPPWPTEIVITATDLLGNEARATVSAIGWLDYRGLPWIPIVGTLVAIAAAALYLRVPRVATMPRRADDDAALEELDPD